MAKKQAKMMKMKHADGNGITEKALVQRVESKPNMAGDGPQKSNQVRDWGLFFVPNSSLSLVSVSLMDS